MTDLTSDTIRGMTSEQAGVELARLSADYQRSQASGADDAQSRLDRFATDPGTAAKLLAGDAATLHQFHELSDAVANSDGMDRLTGIIKGQGVYSSGIETVAGGDLTTRNKMEAVSALRDAGISDGAIVEAMTGNDISTGKPFYAGTVAQASALKATRISDREWTARYMAGGLAERREMTNMNIIIASGVQG